MKRKLQITVDAEAKTCGGACEHYAIGGGWCLMFDVWLDHGSVCGERLTYRDDACLAAERAAKRKARAR